MKKMLSSMLSLVFFLGSATVSAGWDPDEAMEYDAKAQEAIFTQAKGGLMYEASVGGQKLKIEAE